MMIITVITKVIIIIIITTRIKVYFECLTEVHLFKDWPLMKTEITWSVEPNCESNNYALQGHALFPSDPVYCYPSYYVYSFQGKISVRPQFIWISHIHKRFT